MADLTNFNGSPVAYLYSLDRGGNWSTNKYIKLSDGRIYRREDIGSAFDPTSTSYYLSTPDGDDYTESVIEDQSIIDQINTYDDFNTPYVYNTPSFSETQDIFDPNYNNPNASQLIEQYKNLISPNSSSNLTSFNSSPASTQFLNTGVNTGSNDLFKPIKIQYDSGVVGPSMTTHTRFGDITTNTMTGETSVSENITGATGTTFNSGGVRDSLYNPTLSNNSSNNSSNNNWYSLDNLSKGFNTVAKEISKIGGKAGNIGSKVLSTAGSITNNVKKLGEISAKMKAGIQGLGKEKGSNIAAIAGATSDLVGSFLPEKTEYSGDKGDITSTMDTVYDGISDAAMSMGPWGMLVGGIMKSGALLGKGMNAINGGTDGMTTTDAILGSSFFNLTPFGLINGFGGKKADTLTKDYLAFELAGSSYTGTGFAVDDALTKSGKKYGLFSMGAFNKANDLIREARRLQALMSDIADTASDRFTIRNSMAAINGNRRRFNMQGGYDLSAIRVGRHGMIILNLLRAKRITSAIKYLNGGKTTDPFESYLKTLPENLRDSSQFRVRDYWNFNGRPKDFDEAVFRGMFTQFEDGWHANSVAENPKTGEIEFMKLSSHPSILKELDWYESDDASEFRSLYELLKTEPYFKYVKRKGTDSPQSFKEGGNLTKSDWIVEVDINNLSNEFRVFNIAEVDIDSLLPEFKEGGVVLLFNIITELSINNIPEEFRESILELKVGGKFNVIPEGALHARLHHMENVDNLTKKGIPVIDNNGEQQAEIEREEIIFRLEVTKKLEELAKDGSDEAAIEAGKLLVEEILYNTIDNTNNLI